jgi:L-2,4-diaminobutyric acid acetyltransferase
VWQVAVAPHEQGQGLASAMLDALVHRVRGGRRGHPITVEATVAPGNTASRAFFAAFANRHGVALTERPHFVAELLDAAGGHEDEPMLRIGPLVAPLSN